MQPRAFADAAGMDKVNPSWRAKLYTSFSATQELISNVPPLPGAPPRSIAMTEEEKEEVASWDQVVNPTGYCAYCYIKCAKMCPCGLVGYCSKEHQRLDRMFHKPACKIEIKQQEVKFPSKDIKHTNSFKNDGYCIIPCTDPKKRRELYEWAEKQGYRHAGCKDEKLPASDDHVRYYCTRCKAWKKENQTRYYQDDNNSYVACIECTHKRGRGNIVWHQDAHIDKEEYKRKTWPANNVVVLFQHRPSNQFISEFLKRQGLKRNKKLPR
jgi:hypothetical protein